MSKFYEIRFATKKGGFKKRVIHIEANTTKEAKEKMLTMWSADSRFEGMHAFHIDVRKLPDTSEFKYHYFALVP